LIEHSSQSQIPDDLFSAVTLRKFGRSTCFLCGKRLGSNNRSEEHIIPRWVQERFNIWNQRLTLLNDTDILYRQLKIPCCYECNNKHLQPIEVSVSKAVEKGYEAVANLDRNALFIWLGKIYYGILYKELFLAFDRSKSSKSSITDPDLLREYQMHHYFLQSVRVPMEFEQFFPASIFVFEIQMPSEPEYQWDFRDGLFNMFIGCRMGNVGLISVLQDGGAQQKFEYKLEQYKKIALHPVQFLEICALVYYKAFLFNRTPKYSIFELPDGTIKVVQLPLGGFSKKPLFDEWEYEKYANTLAGLLGIPVESIFIPPDNVMTWLHEEDGRIKHLDFQIFPWPPIGAPT
jgi:hypothetical protein